MWILKKKKSKLRGMKKISTISYFPSIFNCLEHGVSSRASSLGITIEHFNIATFSDRKDHRCDDRPFGGEHGMVIKATVIDKALESVLKNKPDALLIVPDPKGKPLLQADAKRLSLYDNLVFLCARYEGIDERALKNIQHEKISIGDVVLSGGELPCAMMIDAILRETNGILGNRESLENDSFQNNRLDYPHYTRPWDWKSMTPPAILRTGHHEKINRWRNQQSLGVTWLNRPELMIGQRLSQVDIEDLMVYLTQLEQ